MMMFAARMFRFVGGLCNGCCNNLVLLEEIVVQVAIVPGVDQHDSVSLFSL